MEPQNRFEELMPRFLKALGKLSKQGLLSRATELLDTLHDFYLESWPGVIARHDPQRGPFDRYAIAALMRFARTRAVRDASLQNRLVRGLDTPSNQENVAAEDADDQRIRAAMAKLSDSHKQLLAMYYWEGASERDMARHLQVTRHLTRVQLAEALAAVAGQLADRAVVSTEESRLAKALFIECEPIELAAADLKVPLARARELRRRMLRRFGRAAKDGMRP